MPSWPLAGSDVCLGADEIHVWCAWLTDSMRDLTPLYTTLSPDEHARASRFHFSTDRHRFIAARGMLRILLAHCLRRDASTIVFSYGPFGKPAIVPVAGDRAVFFNVSHSEHLAVYAVTTVCPVGVDIERRRAIPDVEHLASRFLDPVAHDRVMRLPRERGGGLATRPPRDWNVRAIAPAAEYVGAIAYTHQDVRLTFQQLPMALFRKR